MTLRTKVMLSFVLVVALALGSSGYVFLSYFGASFRQSTLASLDSIALARAVRIADYQRMQVGIARHLGTIIPVKALKEGNYQQIEELLELFHKNFPMFENGFFILSATGENLVDFPPNQENRHKNFAYREYFQRTMNAQRGLIGQPYRSKRSGEAVLTFTAYLQDEDGTPLGVLGCSAQLLGEEGLGQMRQDSIGKTGYSYVYDQSRLMILHPVDERVLTRDVPVGANKLFDAAIEGYSGTSETVNSKGVHMLAAFQHVPGSDWIIACQQPAEEAYAALKTTKLQIMFFVISGSVIAALLGLVLVHRSTAQLVKLEEVTADLSVPDVEDQSLDLLISAETAKLEPFLTHPEFGLLANTIRELYRRLGSALADSHQMTTDLEQAYLQLKQTQGQILQQEKMASIGQLAAGVAHEINNPMGFITSNLGTLAKYQQKLFEYQKNLEASLNETAEEGLKERAQELRKKLKIDYLRDDIDDLLSESKEGAERVREIVQNLKGFSRVDQAEYAEVDLNDCLDKTLSIAANEIKYKAQVEKDYGELPLVACFPQQLNQVFLNLLVNAAQAIEDHGIICISTLDLGDMVQIDITDNGSGIPAENLEKIFEPFFTTKEVGKGTGLGMSISYEIIQKHGGDIQVASEVGQGTTFSITLPIKGEGNLDG